MSNAVFSIYNKHGGATAYFIDRTTLFLIFAKSLVLQRFYLIHLIMASILMTSIVIITTDLLT